LNAYLWISIGAIAGACLRFFISQLSARWSTVFPYNTLLINITGSLLLGFFLVWTTERVLADPRWRLLVAVGFCGSYTTFSSFAFETMSYFEQGHWALLASNVVANNLFCFVAVLAGAALARTI
jgi:CrcB protein